MGLAHVAAACDPKQATCINEDRGLLLGIVVAHEIGHVYCPCVSINHASPMRDFARAASSRRAQRE